MENQASNKQALGTTIDTEAVANKKSRFKIFLIKWKIPILVLLLIIVNLIGFYFSNKLKPQKQPIDDGVYNGSYEPYQNETENWKTYTNNKYQYSIRYEQKDFFTYRNCGKNPSDFEGDEIFLFITLEPKHQYSTCYPPDGLADLEISSIEGDTTSQDEIFKSYPLPDWKVSVYALERNDLAGLSLIAKFQGEDPTGTFPSFVEETRIYKNNRTYLITLTNEEYRETYSQILSTFEFVDVNQTNARPTGYDSPAAGICSSTQDTTIVVTKAADNTFTPKCSQAKSDQRLKIINNSDSTINVNIANYNSTIASGGSYQFPETLGSLLDSGVYLIGGFEIWMQ